MVVAQSRGTCIWRLGVEEKEGLLTLRQQLQQEACQVLEARLETHCASRC